MGRLSIIYCLVAFLFSACSILPPGNTESDYFKTESGGFVLNREAKTIRFQLTISSRKPIKAGSYIEAHFENPMGGDALVSTHTVEPNEHSFVLTSLPVSGLSRPKSYMAQVYLYQDSGKSELLSTHVQRIQNLHIDNKVLGWE